MPRTNKQERTESKERGSKKSNAKEEGSFEEFRVSGEELLARVKKLINEGNARRIIIKNEKGKTLIELPLTIGAVGALLAPALAAVGAVAALVTKCTIVVVKK